MANYGERSPPPSPAGCGAANFRKSDSLIQKNRRSAFRSGHTVAIEFASYTTPPFTTHRIASLSRMFSSGLRSRTTKSASLPASSDPR